MDDTEALAGELLALISRLRRRLHEESRHDDYTPSQVAVLMRLRHDGPATVSDLARAEGVRPQSMGATVAALEAAGLISGERDPGDGRRTVLSLTDFARSEIAISRAAKENWLHRAVRSTFTEAEQEQLGAAVALLRRLADS
ncbi:MarR family winged helix-turn-helix transcriptional regulator [Umezawaea endophytica]|uniref:MarR family transcriptional regulator n=1 Tax=Umezawaea endophytica TaxID=1654476 RepID=A0A9X2VVZ5_9PSEU|nr:MarR family transcriptional regulator [Umezawaea endophytica]MCS7483202.1 MarR family transcriptional regulator [Umezawaea endophytica]